jgi:hypothetical protein
MYMPMNMFKYAVHTVRLKTFFIIIVKITVLLQVNLFKV